MKAVENRKLISPVGLQLSRTRWQRSYLVLLLGMAAATARIAAAQTAWSAQYLPLANAAEQRVEEALRRPARLRLTHVAPVDLAAYLAQREGVPVVVDRLAFEEAGVDPTAPLLSGRHDREPLGAALRALLAPLKLDVTVCCEALLITSQDQAECIPYVRLYPVVDLLVVHSDAVAAHLDEFSPWLTPTERADLQQFLNSPNAIPHWRVAAQFGVCWALQDQIVTHLDEYSWDYSGGEWSLAFLPGPCVLAVNASYRGHRLLDQYLRRLRQERASDARGQARRPPRIVTPEEMREAPSVVVSAEHDATEVVVEALRRPVDWELRDALIGALAPMIARRSGLSVIVDERALEDARVLVDLPLRDARFHDISLAAALEHALSEWDLSYTLAGSVLVLTSADEAATRLHTRAYAVGEILPADLQREWGGWQAVEPPPERLLRREGGYLVAPPGLLRPARVTDSDSLIELVTTVVEPDTWDSNGGEGALEYLPPGRLLVVSQTLEVHRVLEEMLTQLVQYQRLVEGGTP